MISLFYFIILVLSITFLSNFFKKNKLLLSHSGEKHQEYVEKKKYSYDRWNIFNFDILHLIL